jgi:hypothetical protein
VSNRVSRRQANRWQQQEYAQAYEQQQQYAPPPQSYTPPPAPPPPAPPPPAPAPAAAAAPAGDDVSAQLQRLSDLKNQGVLTDEEFAAAKARLLGI